MIESKFTQVNGVRLHYLSSGVGRPLLFIHGFPEYSGAWTPQLREFGKTRRAMALDLRGYNRSDKPAGVDQYHIKILAEDLRQFIEVNAGGCCDVVAHDWGGLCAWRLAARHPECVAKLVIINSPHPAMLYRDLLESAPQCEAMQYVLLFRSAEAEQILSANDFARLSRMFDSWPIGGERLDPTVVAAYKAAWSEPGALTSLLNYYRATSLHVPGPGAPGVSSLRPWLTEWIVRVPTRVIWGERDPALLPKLLDGLGAYVPGVEICRIPMGTHWVAHEFPAEVNRLIEQFFSE